VYGVQYQSVGSSKEPDTIIVAPFSFVFLPYWAEMSAPFLVDPESKRAGHRALCTGDRQMGKKLYVGNLSYDMTSSDLEALFTPHGTVQSAEVIMDRATNQSKGFGFVEMSSDQEAQAAISALNGQDQGGRALKVNEAKPRESRSGGGGGGGGRGGYGGGGGGRRY
jgi:uncharacterized membrane protein YgcG